MPRLLRVSGSEAVRALERLGFSVVRPRDSFLHDFGGPRQPGASPEGRDSLADQTTPRSRHVTNPQFPSRWSFMKTPRFLPFAILCLSCSISHGQTLRIDLSARIAEVAHQPIGINLSYLMDDDARAARTISTANAVAAMRVGFLRYPGGEKSDNYLWSAAPWTSAAPRAARVNAWPATDGRFYENDGETAKADVLDFDEFMVLCQSTGAEPVICVSFDSMYKPASGNETPPTKARLLENAVEWVRYANLVKGYGIKRWTLGNETDYGDSYAGKNPGATTYANEAVQFSQAMKAVDPTIEIGINGHSKAWFQAVLAIAIDDVDFLEVHTYPFYNLSSYNAYRTATWDSTIINEVKNVAKAAIDSLPDAEDRARLYVTLTETGALNFQDPVGWENVNNLGKALATFEIFARHLELDYVKYAMLWNSRWIRNDAGRIAGSTTVAGGEALTAADDPGLELGGTDWPLSADLTISSDAHAGAKALRTTGGYRFRSLPIARFQPNTGYEFSYFGRKEDGSKWGLAGITFYDGASKFEAKPNTNGTSYARSSATVTTPAQFDSVLLWVQSESGGALLADDFSVVTVAETRAAPEAYDALDKAGNFNATGRALAVLGQFVKDDMVSVSGETTGVRSYATRSDAGALSLFIINKELSARTISLELVNGRPSESAARWQFTGTGIGDTEPTWKRVAPIALTAGAGSITLPATSITVLDFAPEPSLTVESVSADDVSAHLKWEASESWLYTWSRRPSLDTGSWIATPPVPGADGAMESEIALGLELPAQQFFRLEYAPLPAETD